MRRRPKAASAAPLPHPKPTRADRRRLEREERDSLVLRRGELRHDAVDRAGGWCEWCRSARVGELHHVVSGNGKRQVEERLDTVAALCVACHQAWHAGSYDVMEQALAWSNRHGFLAARAEIQRRLDKARDGKWALLRDAGGVCR